jgi:hypothetical protein
MMIHCFTPNIYPRLLWIQFGKEMPEGFSGVQEFGENCDAQVDLAHDDEINKGGVFIRFADIDAADYMNITHESIHAAIEILSYCDIKLDADNQEVLTYLAGWVAWCCGTAKESEIKPPTLDERNDERNDERTNQD